MSQPGKFWADDIIISPKPLIKQRKSGASHRIDIAGVASSILATPTIKTPPALLSRRGFSFLRRFRGVLDQSAGAAGLAGTRSG